MRRSTPWLHLLLSFALVFNGIAAAHASTRMLSQHTSRVSSEVSAHAHQVASQASPCHEQAAVLATKHPSDCCESGACRCECAQQSQIVIAFGLFPAHAIVHTTSAGTQKPAHAEVLLPHLIRPPIV